MSEITLSSDQLDKLSACRCDWFVEKHEGPWSWEDLLRGQQPDFMEMEGYQVLLPLDRKHHANITVLRFIPSQEQDVLTIFLEDTTYATGMQAGFLAICERVAGEPWYTATVYHEWYHVNHTRAGA